MNNVNIDAGRQNRVNIPEVVFAKFKTNSSLLTAVRKLLETNGRVLVTKCTKEQLELLKKNFKQAKTDTECGVCIIGEENKKIGSVGVVSAGSSDYFVAEESALCCEFFGLNVHRFYDCGIAGIHRIKPVLENKDKIDVLIVVAGMEGALPSVLSGLVKQPIIAVPTSVGYGTGLNGISALLSMLNSCSPGIAVVNIDNGFGAAAFAYKIIKKFNK